MFESENCQTEVIQKDAIVSLVRHLGENVFQPHRWVHRIVVDVVEITDRNELVHN